MQLRGSREAEARAEFTTGAGEGVKLYSEA